MNSSSMKYVCGFCLRCPHVNFYYPIRCVHKTAKSDSSCPSFLLSIRLSALNSYTRTARLFMKFYI